MDYFACWSMYTLDHAVVSDLEGRLYLAGKVVVRACVCVHMSGSSLGTLSLSDLGHETHMYSH